MNIFSDRERLLRHSILLLVANQVGNLAALLYQVFLMRRLPQSEYGIVAAMLGLVAVFSIPLEALRAAVTHYAARYCQSGDISRVHDLLNDWGKLMAMVAVMVLLAVFAGGAKLAAFFQLPSALILILTALVLAGSLFMPMLGGALQGIQAFWWLALSTQGWGLGRLLAGMTLIVWVQAGAGMALLGQGVGVLLSLLLAAVGLQLALRTQPNPTAPVLSGGGTFFLKSLMILAGYAILSQGDICIVKHYFSPEAAGGFARAATMARSVIFLPVPIALALFPKVVSAGQPSATSRRLLWQALGLVMFLLLGACLGLTLFSDWIWLIFTNQRPVAADIALLRALTWAMAPLGGAYLILNFEIAQQRFNRTVSIILCAVLYLEAVAIWHASFQQIVLVMAVVNYTTLLALAMRLPWHDAVGNHRLFVFAWGRGQRRQGGRWFV